MSAPVIAARLAGSGARDVSADDNTLALVFDDNRLLTLVCGGHDEHLALIEQRLGVDIMPRGNRLAVRGSEDARERTRDVLMALYLRAQRGQDVAKGDVEGAIRMREAAQMEQGGGPDRKSTRLNSSH